MSLGGGTFTTQNKVLPGMYANFISVKSANAALSDRGIATMPLELDWGEEDKVFVVTNEAFQKNTRNIFGYDYTHEKMKGLRDLFLNASTLYVYRLNSGGKKARNKYATAKYAGTRGNDIGIVIQANVDEEDKFDVITLLEESKIDVQTVSSASELKDNQFVTFDKTAQLAQTANTPLSGGTNGVVNGESYQKYADKIESYGFNTMGIVTTDDTIKKLFVAFNKRLRDEIGIKFQLVIYNYQAADYMGVISAKNPCVEDATEIEGKVVYPKEASIVYWLTGVQCACKVNASCQNKLYDGEFEIEADYTQAELISAIKNGEFVLHRENENIRVLEDINTMVTTTDECGEVFKDNQTIRVIDQLANDDAVLFKTKYLGVMPNDPAGRISLWSDLVKIREELQKIRAIEDFSDKDVIVEQGETKKSVVVESNITVVNAMSKMYMTVRVA